MGETGNLGEIFDDAIVDEPANHEALARSQFDIGLNPACRQGRDIQAGDRDAVARVDTRDFRLNVQADGIMPRNLREKRKLNAILAKHDGDRSAVGAGLGDRHRELTAGQEAGFFAIGRDQIRLGEDLEQPA